MPYKDLAVKKARGREYRLSHLDELRAYDRARYLVRREKMISRVQIWSLQNPDKVREHRRKWTRTHPDKVREYSRLGQHRRRASKRNVIVKLTTEQVKEILARGCFFVP